MTTDDLTPRLLAEIRNDGRLTREEIRATNVRIDQLEQRLDGRIDKLEQRLDGRIDGLERRVTESEIRTTTAITEVAGTVREVRDMLRDRLDLRDRVARCESDIQEIKHQIG